jgi:hypothetical protein
MHDQQEWGVRRRIQDRNASERIDSRDISVSRHGKGTFRSHRTTVDERNIETIRGFSFG